MNDVFISYAFEDLDTIVKPLAMQLAELGVSVWFDQYAIKVGDSLHRKIDEGIANSRFGIVVISDSFFEKYFTNYELSGLLQKEVKGTKVILPIWVGVDDAQVRSFSPPLADRCACKWEEGLATVIRKLVEVIKPEVISTLKKHPIIPLPILNTGREILQVVQARDSVYSGYDTTRDEAEINLVGGFIQEIQDWSDIWDEVDVTGQMRAEKHLSEMMQELETAGWHVYGSKWEGTMNAKEKKIKWRHCAVGVFRGKLAQVFWRDGKFICVRSATQSI